jgi:hypothetical protein
MTGLIPSFETVPEGLTMNTVLEEAIEHLKAQHKKNAGKGGGQAAENADQGLEVCVCVCVCVELYVEC